MHAVRRILGAAGLTGALLLAASGAAWADPSASPTASPDPSVTASPAATPGASESPSPAASEVPTPDPSSGCEQDPTICQDTGPLAHPGTTTDCGQINDNGVASPAPPGTVCIASGLNPGTTSGSGGVRPQLPRTGPPPLATTVALGSSLVLLGLLATLAGRRRLERTR